MSNRSLALVPLSIFALLISLAGCGDSDEPAGQAVVVDESPANTEQLAQAESKKQATALVEEAIPLIQQHQLRLLERCNLSLLRPLQNHHAKHQLL